MPNALPGQSSSTPPATSTAPGAAPGRMMAGGAPSAMSMGSTKPQAYDPNGAYGGRIGMLSVVPNSEMDRKAAAEQKAANDASTADLSQTANIGSYIRQLWYQFRNHRNTGDDPINNRLLRAQRMFAGKYDPDKLTAIKLFGGSEVYSRLVAVKCRGATSLLRDVYLNQDRPWAIQPQKDPPVPPEIIANIMQLVSTEVQTMQQAGQPVMPEQAHMRMVGLMHAATEAARRNAMMQTKRAENAVDDILIQGQFYTALAEFLTDLPLFPFAVMKGPVVRRVPRMTWVDGKATIQTKAQMFWERVSPFNFYWTPGASRIEHADTLERKRFTRQELNALIDVPGYNTEAIREVLRDYSRGFRDWLDSYDTEQALNENRENPTMNTSSIIEGLEFNGMIQGQMLLDQNVPKKYIIDPDRDYSVTSWVIGRHVIKTMVNPNPRQRHPYFTTSFEKVPGTVAGHCLPDLLEDLQEICNATLRSMVNNMSIASGPQVVIDTERLSQTEDSDQLYPWKRWHVNGDPMGSQREPITFFQPQSNAQELLQVYQSISQLADDISAIPRYMSGSDRVGGVGRTASGLSMIMGNAEKVLQTVAANIDADVMSPLLHGLYDMIMLTDQTGLLTGDESIEVKGANVAVQQETERSKQLQFLQITGNPIDAPIIGQVGRARVLRSIASGLGLPDDVVPDDQTIQAQITAQNQINSANQALGAANGGLAGPPGPGGQPQPGAQPGQGGPPGQGGGQPPGPQGAGKRGPSPPSALAQGAQPPHATPAKLSDHAPPQNMFQQHPQPPGPGVQV